MINISMSHSIKYFHILIHTVSFLAFGWILFAFGVIQFPVWALIAMIKRREVSNDKHGS